MSIILLIIAINSAFGKERRLLQNTGNTNPDNAEHVPVYVVPPHVVPPHVVPPKYIPIIPPNQERKPVMASVHDVGAGHGVGGATCGDYSGTVDIDGIAQNEHFKIDIDYVYTHNETWAPLIPSGECLQLYEVTDNILMRMRGVAVADLSFLTNAFNDDLIKQGHLYRVEQIRPILTNFGKNNDMYTMAKQLEYEFRRFVILSLLMNGQISAPAGAVDMYWHFFILHTRQYFDFSRNLWGDEFGKMEYRHHYPANDENRPALRDAYTSTRKVLMQCYPQFTPCTGYEDCVWRSRFR